MSVNIALSNKKLERGVEYFYYTTNNLQKKLTIKNFFQAIANLLIDFRFIVGWNLDYEGSLFRELTFNLA